MKKIGFCVCGSFCNFNNTLCVIDNLIENGFDLLPIFSFNAYALDTRFFLAKDFIEIVQRKTNKDIIHTIQSAEQIAKMNLDALLVSPCTGNSMSKIAYGISDTPVTLAVKAQLRNDRPVVIALASNDALGANAKNFGHLLNSKNFFFVPFSQDAPTAKPNSMVAKWDLVLPTLTQALNKEQIQPKIT